MTMVIKAIYLLTRRLFNFLKLCIINLPLMYMWLQFQWSQINRSKLIRATFNNYVYLVISQFFIFKNAAVLPNWLVNFVEKYIARGQLLILGIYQIRVVHHRPCSSELYLAILIFVYRFSFLRWVVNTTILLDIGLFPFESILKLFTFELFASQF